MENRLMLRTAPTILSVAALFLATGLVGCGGSPTPSSAESGGQAAAGDDAGIEHAGTDGDPTPDMDKMHATLAKLPEADRKSAEKQHFCPVSGEMLGLMGLPIKVTIKGRDVWLCCESCKEKLLADPDTYLAKLNK